MHCSEHHDQVETDLIEEFKEAYYQGNLVEMKACADTLLPFKVSNHTNVHNILYSSCAGQYSKPLKDKLHKPPVPAME